MFHVQEVRTARHSHLSEQFQNHRGLMQGLRHLHQVATTLHLVAPSQHHRAQLLDHSAVCTALDPNLFAAASMCAVHLGSLSQRRQMQELSLPAPFEVHPQLLGTRKDQRQLASVPQSRSQPRQLAVLAKSLHHPWFAASHLHQWLQQG